MSKRQVPKKGNFRKQKVLYDARVEFIREKQIPRLEKTGFVNLLGTEWFRLSDLCFIEDRSEEGNAALGEAETYLAPGRFATP